jgi:transposase
MSQNHPILYIGLDVAKRSFVVHCQERCQELSNDARGHGRLLRLLAKVPGTVHVVLEATGGYEAPIVAALHRAQILCSVVLPGRVRAYAKALGRHAKSDPIDAALLSAYGHAIEPLPTPARSAHQQTFLETVRQRQQLVDLRTLLQNQAAHLQDGKAQRRHQKVLQTLATQIADCERQLTALQGADANLQQRSARLQQVPGVGPIVAATLLAEMPELGSLQQAEAAALAGVAPYNCESGPWKGTRRIAGGRAPVRRALYMAALTARRKDGILKRCYEALLARGKKKLVALTALMRKLILLLNRLLKDPLFHLQPS